MAKNRLFISTDMQMITGVNHIDGDKDDVQSFVHALMYQDKFKIVGIASTTSQHQPGANDTKFIHHVIDKYALDQAKLAAHGDPGDFQTAAQLHAITYQGTKALAGSSGVPKATAASAAIIKEARAAEAAGEKLYVSTWGGVGDIARALSDAPDIADSVRLISSSGKNQESTAYKYMVNNFAGQKGFWWIDVNETLRGVYSGEKAKLPLAVTLSHVEEFAKGHGTLGNVFYENSQDLRGKGDTYSGLKMGDSAGILYLIDKANNDDPTAESWGGEYRLVKNDYWTDRTDAGSSLDYAASHGARTIFEDRAAWLGEFKARFDWLKGGKADPAPAPTPEPSKPGSDTITVKVSGDAYKGDPNFALIFDGKTIDATNVVTADRAAGAWQTFTFTGDFDQDGVQAHKVGIKFTNDLYKGADQDRNLLVDEVSLNGVTHTADVLFTRATTHTWDFSL